MRPCWTFVCWPPENVPCTDPKFGTPSSRANSEFEHNLRTSGVEEKCDFIAAVDPYADKRKRIGPQKFHVHALSAVAQFVWRLTVEALQLRYIQSGVLRKHQLIGAQIDPA